MENQLFTQQEIQAMLSLLNRIPMTPAEMLFAQGFFTRLAAFCAPHQEQPPKPEPKKKKGEDKLQ